MADHLGWQGHLSRLPAPLVATAPIAGVPARSGVRASGLGRAREPLSEAVVAAADVAGRRERGALRLALTSVGPAREPVAPDFQSIGRGPERLHERRGQRD